MLLFYFLFWTAVTANKEPLYRKIGDKAVLTPASVVNPITSIEWKHGPDLAMEWFGGETFSHRHFKDRGLLNISTGALTITGLTRNNSGNYTVEINNKVTSKTQLLVISPVSKPTLSIWCEPEMTYCVLTCNGDTTGAEPVTYRWTSGDKSLSSTKEHNITKEDNELWFSCAFENPVSINSSEIVFNPFMEKEPLYGKIGDKAELTADSVVNLITSIVWKHEPDLAMEWNGENTTAYQHFKDRGSLDTSTGALTITGLTPDDSGNYTVEINNKVTSKTELLVISPVSKPTLFDWCTVTYCVFTCNGDTTGAEPVTYWWTSGDITWSSTKEHKITVMKKEMWFSWFSCAFENPVSFNSSEKVFNPFIRNLIIFMVILFLVVCIIIITFRRKGIINFSRKWIKEVLTWMIIFMPVPLFIMVVLIIIISYLEYKGREVFDEDLTKTFIVLEVVGVILVVCIISIIIIYLKYRARFRDLTRMFIFIPLCILVVFIIILYLIFKDGNVFDEDLTRTFIVLEAVGVILVGFIIIIIYLIYNGITFFRRKRREGEAETRWQEFLEKWNMEFQEMLDTVNSKIPEINKTSTQDLETAESPDTSNETGEADKRKWQEMLKRLRQAFLKRLAEGDAAERTQQRMVELLYKGEAAEREWQEYLEKKREGAAERARQAFQERWDKVNSTISEVHKTSTQDLETAESPDTSNETERPASLVAVQETSPQDTTSTGPPETSKETEMSMLLPPVENPSTQDPTSVVTQDPSNETEESPMIPDDLDTRC